MTMLSPTAADRHPILRLRSLALLTVSSWRRALNRKLSERQEASMLRRFDRRLLEDFGAESFATDDQLCDTPDSSELKAGPLMAIYLAQWQLPGKHSRLDRDVMKIKSHRLL